MQMNTFPVFDSFPPIFNQPTVGSSLILTRPQPWTAAPHRHSPLMYACHVSCDVLTVPGYACEAAEHGRVHDVSRTCSTAQARVPAQDRAEDERADHVAILYGQVQARRGDGGAE